MFSFAGHILSALFFDFSYFLCCCGHNPSARIAHIVKERVKLPPICVFPGGAVKKELVYGYIITLYKLCLLYTSAKRRRLSVLPL